MTKPAHLELLRALSTDESPHSGRTLLDHLQGTQRRLEQWGNPEDICVAGLFHSIYGTEFYKTRSADLSQRDEIRKEIGRRAEELAYLFSACDRRHAFSNVERAGDFTIRDLFQDGRETPISAATLRALLEIEAANWLDQAPPGSDMPAERRAFWWNLWQKAEPFLSEGACRSLREYYEDQAPASLGPAL